VRSLGLPGDDLVLALVERERDRTVLVGRSGGDHFAGRRVEDLHLLSARGPAVLVDEGDGQLSRLPGREGAEHRRSDPDEADGQDDERRHSRPSGRGSGWVPIGF
jgi:hypothetical protein